MINSPLMEKKIEWCEGICVQQSGVTEQCKYLESMREGAPPINYPWCRTFEDDPTIYSYIVKQKAIDNETEELSRQRHQADLIRMKVIREEQEAKQRIRLLKALEEKLEERFEILHAETEAIAAQRKRTLR